MWGNLGPELSPVVTVVSAVLVVVVLVIALTLRNKITRTEKGNEFLFWGKRQEEDEINKVLGNEDGEADYDAEEENDDEDETE